MTRAHLPNRRPSHLETLEVAGQTFEVCVGFDPATGEPREVFLNGAKEGSQFLVLMADAAILISIALQHGIRPAAMAKSMNRLPPLEVEPGSLEQLGASMAPASPIGAALDLLCRLEPRVACKGAKEYSHK